jgi:hypothetical protein
MHSALLGAAPLLRLLAVDAEWHDLLLLTTLHCPSSFHLLARSALSSSEQQRRLCIRGVSVCRRAECAHVGVLLSIIISGRRRMQRHHV